MSEANLRCSPNFAFRMRGKFLKIHFESIPGPARFFKLALGLTFNFVFVFILATICLQTTSIEESHFRSTATIFVLPWSLVALFCVSNSLRSVLVEDCRTTLTTDLKQGIFRWSNPFTSREIKPEDINCIRVELLHDQSLTANLFVELHVAKKVQKLFLKRYYGPSLSSRIRTETEQLSCLIEKIRKPVPVVKYDVSFWNCFGWRRKNVRRR